MAAEGQLLLGAGSPELISHPWEGWRCLQAVIKPRACTVNLLSLSVEEVTNVHQIAGKVIKSPPGPALTALPHAARAAGLVAPAQMMNSSQGLTLQHKKIWAALVVLRWHREGLQSNQGQTVSVPQGQVGAERKGASVIRDS